LTAEKTSWTPKLAAICALIASVFPLSAEQSDPLEPPFLLQVGKVIAEPGELVKVPVLLSSLADSIGGWDVLIEYDDSLGRVVGAGFCDSVLVNDSLWYYAPWVLNPDLSVAEYSYISLNIPDHPDWVRFTAIMDMPGGAEVPPLPPGAEQLLFCMDYDLSPLWNGRDVDFSFQTNDCGDNVLGDRSGYVVWGPDTISASRSTCLQRPDSLRLVRLIGGVGISTGTGIDGIPPSPFLETFELHHYPNPFSSSMQIEFFLPEDARVGVRIYNLAGELVKTLVDSRMRAGGHTVGWDARNAASGVYFYRIDISSKQTTCNATEKIILLR
jgi:hypothetical protein